MKHMQLVCTEMLTHSNRFGMVWGSGLCESKQWRKMNVRVIGEAYLYKGTSRNSIICKTLCGVCDMDIRASGLDGRSGRCM